MLELFKELTSRDGQLAVVSLKEITGRATQEYIDRLRALLEKRGQEANEAELNEAGSDLLGLFDGNHDEELLRRRIELGRKLGATC
jgi:transposase